MVETFSFNEVEDGEQEERRLKGIVNLGKIRFLFIKDYEAVLLGEMHKLARKWCQRCWHPRGSNRWPRGCWGIWECQKKEIIGIWWKWRINEYEHVFYFHFSNCIDVNWSWYVFLLSLYITNSYSLRKIKCVLSKINSSYAWIKRNNVSKIIIMQ